MAVPSTDGMAAGQGGGGVHDQDVAGVEEAREVGGTGMDQRAGGPLGHEHADLVAPASVVLDGVIGDEVRGHLDVERPVGEPDGGHHATSSGAGTSVTW